MLCNSEAYSKDIDEKTEKKLDFSIEPYQYEPMESNGEEESEDEASSENIELDTDGIAFSFRCRRFEITYLAVIARCCLKQLFVK